MSKFKRVSELTVSDHFVKALNPEYSGDKYAALKKKASENQHKIAKNNSQYKTSQRTEPFEWEREVQPEMYRDYSFPKNESEYNNMEYLGSNSKIVRKSDYATDQDFTAKNLEFFTPEQYTQALIKQATVFDPNMEDIVQAFNQSQETSSEIAIMNSETRNMIKQSKNERWHEKANSTVRESKYSTARANPILKTQNEFTADGRFGLMDWTELDINEQNRLNMREQNRVAKAQIKAKGRSRQEVHENWENNIVRKSQTYNDYYNTIDSSGIDLMID